MSIVINNTSYSGEVLENLLTVAATGNEIVEKGLMMVIPGVNKSISLPRLKTGKMLQKRKENPDVTDSKGDFNYSEKKLTPRDMMALTLFNPRTFESIWRPFQPKGDLVFRELPPNVQNKFLEELSKQVKFELGDLYISGEYVENGTDEQLMDGILTQMAKDDEVVVVNSTATTMLNKLKAVRSAIPKAMRNNPNLRIIMSIDDFDKYDDELTEREYKNSSESDINVKRYKGITIETLAAWPDDLIVATLCSMGSDGNFFAAVNLSEEEDVIKIARVSEMSELFFFKLLMKVDTNIAFGEECIVLDTRETPVFTVPTEETDDDDDDTVTEEVG